MLNLELYREHGIVSYELTNQTNTNSQSLRKFEEPITPQNLTMRLFALRREGKIDACEIFEEEEAA